MITIK